MAQQQDYLSYLNGRVMPHSVAQREMQVQGLQNVGGFYDTERTFGGKLFKLRQHLHRMYNGLDYSGIDPGMTIDEMQQVTIDLLQSNESLIAPGQEVTVTQVVTATKSNVSDAQQVTVLIYLQHLDVSAFAASYLHGVRVVTPATYAVPEGSSEAEVKFGSAQVIPLMTNREGSITECKGANFMFVRDGRIKLPDRSDVLPGVSMHTVLELAEELGVAVDEAEYSPCDVYEAQEAFVSSTRYCMLPVASLNGYTLGEGVPGDVTSRLLDSWREFVGVDFVQRAIDTSPSDFEHS